MKGSIQRNPFLARTPEERVIEAVERLKFDVQYALQVAMKKRGVTQAELAERLGVTPARVSQMFAWGANPRVGTVAKAFAVLDEDIFFESETVPFAPRMGEEKRVRETASPAKALDVTDPEICIRIERELQQLLASGKSDKRDCTPGRRREADAIDASAWRSVQICSKPPMFEYRSAANDSGASGGRTKSKKAA